jgi:chemotaxis protein methyltransferase CheR
MAVSTAAAAVAQKSTELTQAELARFTEFFYRHTGILFGEQKRYFVERRILERIAATNSENFCDYFLAVRFDPTGQEMQRLVNAMTVNETYFYREDYQFAALIDGVLPELARRRRTDQAIRIWSVPCSTGEEPYSIAMSILEQWAQADDYRIEIMGSDIDSHVLSQAREGLYNERSLQRLTPALRERYFVRTHDGRYRLSDDIRGSIDFAPVNVVDPISMGRYRAIDVIFCRNMLIYFDDLSRRQAVEAMYECLAPGGYIFLGHSESMSRMSSLFRAKKIGGAVLYCKPMRGGAE